MPSSAECRDMIDRCALVTISRGGGKDSRRMTTLVSRVVPRERPLVVHAPLGEAEWSGTVEHIVRTLLAGAPLILARTASDKSLPERIKDRGRFPSVGARYCTSDTKRTAIERELRHYLKAQSRYAASIISAMGTRAAESPSRSKLAGRAAPRPQHQDGAGVVRLASDPRPRDPGHVPRHRRGWPVAALGLWRRHAAARLLVPHPRLPSRSASDRTATPRALYQEYVALERRIGHAFSPTRVALPALTGVPATSSHGQWRRRTAADIKIVLRVFGWLSGNCRRAPLARELSSIRQQLARPSR